MAECNSRKQLEFSGQIAELMAQQFPSPPESAFPFAGEARAAYYSILRRNMQTVAAGMVMNDNQQLDDLDAIRKMREKEEKRG